MLCPIKYHGITYPCALVNWFKKVVRSPDSETGMWVVQPELDNCGDQLYSVLHLDSFICGAHLIPVYGSDFIPVKFCHILSLDAFDAFHVNKFIDYHANEIIF